MIEQCGLKGKTVGGAMVSPKHAGFIVNTGDANMSKCFGFISLIQTTVKEQTGIMLNVKFAQLADSIGSDRIRLRIQILNRKDGKMEF